MLHILVAGGFDASDPRRPDIERFCRALGEVIISQGHRYLNGCLTELDKLIATAAHEKLLALKVPDPDRHIISYLLANQKPIHQFGTIIRSRLTDWEIGKDYLYIPEQIRQADAVILIAGFEGTYRAANWASISKKPLLPVTAFGGAAARIFEKELDEFDQRYAGRVDRFDYEELNSAKSDWENRAVRIVSLAERLSGSNSVCVVMSYSGRADLEDAYESFQVVCENFKYKCERVSNANTLGRIVPRIHEKIAEAAFVIVDVTEAKPNVYYELGLAKGFDKPLVLTARAGTDLPFDINDMPTIFWDSQKKLKEELKTKVALIAERQGRDKN